MLKISSIFFTDFFRRLFLEFKIRLCDPRRKNAYIKRRNPSSMSFSFDWEKYFTLEPLETAPVSGIRISQRKVIKCFGLLNVLVWREGGRWLDGGNFHGFSEFLSGFAGNFRRSPSRCRVARFSNLNFSVELHEISHQFSFVLWNIQRHIFAFFLFSGSRAIHKIHQTISRRFFMIFRRFSRLKVLQWKNQRSILNDSF